VGFVIRDRFGNDVFGSNTHHPGCARRTVAPAIRSRVAFEVDLCLRSGQLLGERRAPRADNSHVEANYDWWDRALLFDVLP
jgi:lipopolysaccharide transport system ATP-binding protein